MTSLERIELRKSTAHPEVARPQHSPAFRARWLMLGLVIALHIVSIYWVTRMSPREVVDNRTKVIHASLQTSRPVEKVSEEAKPLPAKAKPRPKVKSTMIAAPLAPAPERSETAALAPAPALESDEADDEEDTAPPRGDADYLSNPAPEYPRISKRQGEEGKVLLRVHVEVDGVPSEVQLDTSSGFERLDRAAIAAVSQWKFVPAKKGKDNVAAWVIVPIVFTLKGQS